MSRYPLAYLPTESTPEVEVYQGNLVLESVGLYLDIEIKRHHFYWDFTVSLYVTATQQLLVTQTERILRASSSLDRIFFGGEVQELYLKNRNILNRRDPNRDDENRKE